ncbi:hypothetical protein ACFYUR_03085 [Micromonospora haikouensis]|uniref:hypothetical protein n=1 Tax=Micromonospora haikouensis TaxID=686309 RepID=UPI0036C0DE43
MSWDELSLIILAAFGCLTLLLAQVDETLSKLPRIIRVWRQVRNELRNRTDHNCQDASSELRTEASDMAPGSDARLSGTPCQRGAE